MFAARKAKRFLFWQVVDTLEKRPIPKHVAERFRLCRRKRSEGEHIGVCSRATQIIQQGNCWTVKATSWLNKCWKRKWKHLKESKLRLSWKVMLLPSSTRQSGSWRRMRSPLGVQWRGYTQTVLEKGLHIHNTIFTVPHGRRILFYRRREHFSKTDLAQAYLQREKEDSSSKYLARTGMSALWVE